MLERLRMPAVTSGHNWRRSRPRIWVCATRPHSSRVALVDRWAAGLGWTARLRPACRRERCGSVTLLHPLASHSISTPRHLSTPACTLTPTPILQKTPVHPGLPRTPTEPTERAATPPLQTGKHAPDSRTHCARARGRRASPMHLRARPCALHTYNLHIHITRPRASQRPRSSQHA